MKRVVCLVLSLVSIELCSVPARVFIIRHGEKTKQKQQVDFKQWHLKKSKPLSVRGEERAYALAPYLSQQLELMSGSLKGIFAPKPDAAYNSVRPIQTITPFSKKVHMAINTKFGLDQMADMVDHIMTKPKYHDGVVVIAYEHKHIPALLSQFQVPNALAKWPGKVFDWLVSLEFDTKTGRVVNYSINPQQLLYGDSAKVHIGK